MVKPQTVRSIYKLVASMSSLMKCFSAIAGSIREKTKMDITRPPLMDILMKYVFVLLVEKGFTNQLQRCNLAVS